MEGEHKNEGPAATPENADDSKKVSGWVQAAKYSQAAMTLPASVLAGVLIGAALDKWLHKSWITVVGLILGAIAGFVELIRVLMKASASDDAP